MINAKKGTAHGLLQSDFIGAAKTGEGVKAGMLVRIDTTGWNPTQKGSYASLAGFVVKAGAAASATATDAVNASKYGFAVTNQDEGDALESGVIGAYTLDGNSVIETDQTDVSITAGNFPIGASVGPDATATGKVRNVTGVANAKVVGVVDGIRSIHGTTVVAIKLKA